ncbi:ribonuclease P protein subunit rpr2 [Cephus cinctus]|uniref:Ribonuclease P protein subunit rpr2 n=1 Tax=Cephus cinctus TaxID=211228 RepID=A0AAJ7BLR5_CEPCN|nr:ribonuclease P protein subunit rpr2 [Cephus cinctus]
METEVKLCQGKDVFERMNYLYQASQFVASKNKTVASYYGNVMVNCGKKAVLRMEPDLKRSICKSCQTPLIPGETARVRLGSKPRKLIRWTCLTCRSIKKFPTKQGHKLWSDQAESIVQIFDYARYSKMANGSSVQPDSHYVKTNPQSEAMNSASDEKPSGESVREIHSKEDKASIIEIKQVE